MILISNRPVIKSGTVTIHKPQNTQTAGEHVHKKVVNTPTIQHSGQIIIHKD
jgi:hypothetical protein